jgi:Mor family transcriptional regulator
MDFLTELRDLDIPENIIKKIELHFGGNPVYIPKIKAVDINKRNAEICRRFNGKNHADLVREFSLCYQQICKILAADRRKLSQKNVTDNYR